MINVEMHGRLGNQLFQYAAARSLQEKTKQPLLFSFRTVFNEQDKEGNIGWEDSLKDFNVKPYQTYKGKKSVLFLNTTMFQKIIGLIYYFMYKPILLKDEFNFQKLYKYQIKWQNLLSKNGIWWLKQGYYSYSLSKNKTYVLNGGFESKKYFDEIRPLLIDEITPIHEIHNEEKQMIEYLKSVNSVCISIRHFSLENKKREQIFDVCDIEYYKKAIKKIQENVSKPVFYICSNDQEWVKQNFDFGENNIIYENANNKVAIKLYLMTKCKHFIISNSTFSWWAQYLGTYEKKIVISPSKWYNSEFMSDLLNDEEFIKL